MADTTEQQVSDKELEDLASPEPVEKAVETFEDQYDIGWAGTRAESEGNLESEQTDEEADVGYEPEPEPDSMPESVIDDDMINLAESLGVPRDVAQEFESAADLTRTLRLMGAMNATQRGRAEPKVDQSRMGIPTDRPVRVRQEKSPRGFTYNVDVSQIEDVDEALRKMGPHHREWAEHTNTRFDENEEGLYRLAKHVGALGVQLQSLVDQQQTETMDQFFAGLDDEYKKELGDGPTNRLPPNSKERRLRNKIIKAHKDWTDMFRARGQRPDLEEIRQRALNDVFFKNHRKANRAAKTAGRAKRRTQVLPEPTAARKTDSLFDQHEAFLQAYR